MASVTKAAPSIAFGEAPVFSSDNAAAYSRSDDAKAFDIRFPVPLNAAVGTGTLGDVKPLPVPIATAVYSAVIPAAGRKVKASFNVNGFGLTDAGTLTALVLVVNDQHIVVPFLRKRKEQGFTASLAFSASAVEDVRISLFLRAERDSKHPDASALIAFTDIGADTFKPKQPARKAAAKKASPKRRGSR